MIPRLWDDGGFNEVRWDGDANVGVEWSLKSQSATANDHIVDD